jgi:two-component system, OmpR family, phosphate regulon sensor histidine kinase PhoR
MWGRSVGAFGVGGAIVVAGLVVVLLARWGSVLGALARGLSALVEGKTVRTVREPSVGPVGLLARTFNTLAPQLEDRLGRLERDVQQLRAVLSGMAESVIAVDSRRRLLFANESADRLFGLSQAAVGRLVVELIRSPKVHDAVDAALAGPDPYRGEIALEGREPLAPSPAKILEVLGTRLPGNPPRGAVLVFHDVTDLRRLERMRQDFVANVSHELKTPLASIKAYTETLLEWALHDEKVNVRFLQQIAEQADRLDRLVLDLLSLARLESGQEVYEHRPLALAPVVRAASESHQGRAEAKRIDYRIDLVGLDPATEVSADEEAIHQILDNLIDNAFKYTPEGGRIVVSGQLKGDDVLLVVTDTGVGIPRADLPRIFERFYRVDKARSRELGGTGLGLAIVKHLAQSLGGRVDVTSRLGTGSEFTVRLPRLKPQPS